MNLLFFTFILATNFWIWRIASTNIIVAILCLATAYFLYKATQTQQKLMLTLFTVVLLIFQYTTTVISPLTSLSPDEMHIQQIRLNSYPQISINLFGEKHWIPIAHWIEGRPESITLTKVQKNFAETLNPSLFFFANHPRERVGVKEFEKFAYILLPAFIMGLLLVKKTQLKTYSLAFIPQVILLSLIGHNNPLGPFSLFPFFVVIIANGFIFLYSRLGKNRILIIGIAIIIVLVLIQTLAYAKN